MTPVKTSSWSVRYTLPQDEAKGRRWAINLTASCVAHTLDRASELILATHPDAVIYAVNHKGHDVVYLDPWVFLETPGTAIDGEKCPADRRNRVHSKNDLGTCDYCAGRITPPPLASEEQPK